MLQALTDTLVDTIETLLVVVFGGIITIIAWVAMIFGLFIIVNYLIGPITGLLVAALYFFFTYDKWDQELDRFTSWNAWDHAQ